MTPTLATGLFLSSMENMRNIIEIDVKNKTVTAECGITVQELFQELSNIGFSLPNITSIASQQIGGWSQTGSHGTGLNLPPIDEFIEQYKIFSPTYPNGLVLSKNDPVFNPLLVPVLLIREIIVT